MAPTAESASLRRAPHVPGSSRLPEGLWVASSISLLLLAPLSVGLSARPALAHPAPFAHKHSGSETKPRPAYSRPRRGHEPTRRRGRASLGIGAVGAFLVNRADGEMSRDLTHGAGVDVSLGLRLSQMASLEFAWLTTVHGAEREAAGFDQAMITALTGGVRVFVVPSWRRLEPFVLLGVGATLISSDGSARNDLTGPGFEAGAGVDWHLSPGVALSTRVLYGGSAVDDKDRVLQGGAVESATLHLITVAARIVLAL